MSERKVIDWELIERHYRAGLLSLREIARDVGVTEGAIRKRAKRDGWSRNLTAKIQQKAEELVRTEELKAVRTESTQLTAASEKEVVQSNAELVAQVDLSGRRDVGGSLDAARSMLGELSGLCDPKFRERLEWLGEVMDESGLDYSGKMVKDRVNELYRYIISLPGRIKMIKEMAAAHGVYIPLQRKIYKLDSDEDKSQSAVDELLRKINTEG